MATIEKRKSGDKYVYRARVRVKGAVPRTATFPSKTLAKAWAQKLEVQIKENQYLPTMQSHNHTLNDVIAEYKTRAKDSKRPISETTQIQLNVWDELIGAYTLNMITPERIYNTIKDIEAIPTQSGNVKSPSTLNRYLAVLSAVLTFAVKELGWLHENPAFKVSRRPEPKGRVRYLSDDERNRLIEQVKKAKNPFLYPAVMVAISTGARRNEILTLKWADVDLKRGWATLQKTKNGDRRGIALRGPALDAMKELYKHRLSDIWVFPNEFNSGPFNIRKSWDRAVKDAGLVDFRFHDLRHTCASYLIMNGASLGEIADVLGHKTLQMVQRYAHISDQHKGDVIDRMNAKIFGGKNG